jgi:hypothetical protein
MLGRSQGKMIGNDWTAYNCRGGGEASHSYAAAVYLDGIAEMVVQGDGCGGGTNSMDRITNNCKWGIVNYAPGSRVDRATIRDLGLGLGGPLVSP